MAVRSMSSLITEINGGGFKERGRRGLFSRLKRFYRKENSRVVGCPPYQYKGENVGQKTMR